MKRDKFLHGLRVKRKEKKLAVRLDTDREVGKGKWKTKIRQIILLTGITGCIGCGTYPTTCIVYPLDSGYCRCEISEAYQYGKCGSLMLCDSLCDRDQIRAWWDQHSNDMGKVCNG